VDDGIDIVRLARETIGFPCVLKPRFSDLWDRHHTGVKLTVSRDAEELHHNYRRMLQTGETVLLQEFIPGDDSALHGYLAYYGANGLPLAAFTKQKLRQYPPTCGNGSLMISTKNREIAQVSENILNTLAYQGLVSIEYKWDYRDQRYKLIEINPRSVSWNQLAIDCGVDFPYIAYRNILGVDAPTTTDYRSGIKYLHLGWDVQSLLAQRRNGSLTILKWLSSLRGVRSLAVFNLRDIKPFLAYVRMMLKAGLKRAPERKLMRPNEKSVA
jgi:D-aspartate ligase